MPPSLLFCKLVHVIQYRLLGVSGFAKHYIHGLLSSGSYHDIPRESCAFEWEGRLVAGAMFDVETEVAAWLRKK